MTCKKCGANLLDGSKFCTVCGAEVTEPDILSVEADHFVPDSIIEPAKPKKKKNGAATLGVLIGLVCVIAGLIVMFTASSSLSSTSFGGDFYTYAYRGIRAVEKAVVIAIRLGGGLLSAFGAFMACHFGCIRSAGKDD